MPSAVRTCSRPRPPREQSRTDRRGHRPRIPVPLITPWLSSLWIGLVTSVDAGVARPLIEGLSVPTVVSDPSGMALFDIEPIGFAEALRAAVLEEVAV